MRVRDIMSTDVKCLTPETGIKEVAIHMKTLDVGFIPICENDRLVGAITDRDIVLRAIAEGREISTCTARDIMTKDVFWCYEDDSVKDVAKKMREKDVRRMLILNHDKKLVGVVSLGDLSKVEEKVSGQTLRDISEAA